MRRTERECVSEREGENVCERDGEIVRWRVIERTKVIVR